MKVENCGNEGGMLTINIIRSLPVSCVNRDEAGTPKTVNFGGSKRARQSSASVKSPMRNELRENLKNGKFFQGIRTPQIEEEITKRLISNGIGEENAKTYTDEISEVIRGGKTQSGNTKKNKKNKQKKDSSSDVADVTNEAGDEKKRALLFLSSMELDAIANGIIEKKKSGEKMTKADVVKLIGGHLPEDGFDIRLCGRMVATITDLNIDGCLCVAHPISTHTQSPETDFFAAMDQLSSGRQGAAHIGSTEYTAAVMYECFVLDTNELFRGYDHFTREVKSDLVSTIIKAILKAIPQGRRHGMFADVPVDYVLALRWKATPLNLVNAFHESVRDHGQGLINASIDALKNYWIKLEKSYGEECGVKQISEFVLGETSIGEFSEGVANELIK